MLISIMEDTIYVSTDGKTVLAGVSKRTYGSLCSEIDNATRMTVHVSVSYMCSYTL